MTRQNFSGHKTIHVKYWLSLDFSSCWNWQIMFKAVTDACQKIIYSFTGTNIKSFIRDVCLHDRNIFFLHNITVLFIHEPSNLFVIVVVNSSHKFAQLNKITHLQLIATFQQPI